MHSKKVRKKAAGRGLGAMILIFVLGQNMDAQSTASQATQPREYWLDPSSRLMWAGRDNGKDVTWYKAVKHCRDLHLAGHSNWRLATLYELATIYDPSLNAPGLAGRGNGRMVTWHIKGNIFITGMEWSANRRLDDRGKPSGYEWYFDFNDGRTNNEASGLFYPSTFMRALCVRGTEVVREKSAPTLQPIP